MELISINSIKEIQPSRATKKVPIVTEQLMTPILFIGPDTRVPAHTHTNDEIDYVVKGSGEITIGKRSRGIKEGMLFLIPKSKPHYFSTNEEEMIILSISTVTDKGEYNDIIAKTVKKSKRRKKGGKKIKVE